jgi:hypothetical protein
MTDDAATPKATTPQLPAGLQIRSTKTDAPFLWASLATLTRIREHIGPDPIALATYFALCAVATIRRSPRFSCTIAQIAGHAGARYRRTWQALKDLEKAGLVWIARSSARADGKANLPHSFALLSMRRVRHNMQKGSAPHAEGVRHHVQKGSAQESKARVQIDW